MLRCLALGCLLGVAGALWAPLAGGRRARGARARGSVRLQDAPPPPNLDLASLFEDKPPPSWGSEDWRWGYADGEAHTVAVRVREELDRPHRRATMLSYARMGAVDFFDLKMALALKCQRARNLGYDAPDGRWEALMEEMAAAKFETDGMIDQHKLAAACNERLPKAVDAATTEENPATAVAEALDHLSFVEKGL